MIDGLKKALIQVLSKQAYVALLGIPGFGWVFGLPVIRNITQWVIERVVSWSVQETAVGLSLLWIQIDMVSEVNSAEDARKKLDDMLNHPQKYTFLEQNEISEYFDQTTIDLIQLGLKRLS